MINEDKVVQNYDVKVNDWFSELKLKQLQHFGALPAFIYRQKCLHVLSYKILTELCRFPVPVEE